MSVISSLLERIKTKRVERFSSVAERYDAIVGQLARNQEVDADDLAGLLDELDKSESDLQDDVDAKQRRIAAAAELERLADVAREIPPLESQVERLVAEIENFVAPRKAKLSELRESLKYKRLDADRVGYVRDELLRVGVPLSIQARQQELEKRRSLLGERIEQHRQATERPQADLNAFRVRLVAEQQKAAKAVSDFEKREVAEEISKITERITRRENELAPWVRHAEEIAQEQRELAIEQEAINRALMQP